MLFVSVLLTFCQIILAAPKPEDEIPPRLDGAVAHGLAFLAKQQNPDGSFEGGTPKVATTGLCVLAYLGAGHAPDLGKYGLVVHNAIEFLLARQAQDGYFGAGDRGMYTHGIATLALAETCGVETSAARRVRIRAALEKAVTVILNAQNAPKSNPGFQGGWRYERNSADSDLSLCGWNALALRAAQDVGIEVPQESRQRAVEFVLRCYNANAKGFAYQPGGDAQPGDTAIGILCLYLLGASDGNVARLDAAAQFLQNHPIDENIAYPYYATYYVTQAAFQRDADAWPRVGRPGLERLIRTQEKDGSWPPSKSGQEPGHVYPTAMAVQALTVPYRLLPVYQR
ncbi:MAG TPA: prenyltransferase/squalene oxidase repeat-containing protein [Tepidisphaeraceae bacterium]|jgi:hypothetical protein